MFDPELTAKCDELFGAALLDALQQGLSEAESGVGAHNNGDVVAAEQNRARWNDSQLLLSPLVFVSARLCEFEQCVGRVPRRPLNDGFDRFGDLQHLTCL